MLKNVNKFLNQLLFKQLDYIFLVSNNVKVSIFKLFTNEKLHKSKNVFNFIKLDKDDKKFKQVKRKYPESSLFPPKKETKSYKPFIKINKLNIVQASFNNTNNKFEF